MDVTGHPDHNSINACPYCNSGEIHRKGINKLMKKVCVTCGDDFEEYTVKYLEVETGSNICPECLKTCIEDEG